MFIFYIYIYIL